MNLTVRDRAQPKRPKGDTQKLLAALKKANQEVETYRRKFVNAKQEREQLLARLLEDVELDPALLELEAVQI